MKNIIIKPVITEKANGMNEAGKYVFIVDKNANKIEIGKAIEKLYGVKVQDVNTMRYQGKQKTRYTKSKILTGRRPSFKKAVIQVVEGEIIDIYGNI